MSTSGPIDPLVSVIVPAYNAADFLRRSLGSVFEQTMQDFELIVVNDGSTDDSLQILQELEAAHPNMRLMDQPNAGQGAARNRALDAARGEYVFFLDADDFIERVALEVTTARAEEDQSDFVHFDWKLYTPKAGPSGDFHYYNADPFWHKKILQGARVRRALESSELLFGNQALQAIFLGSASD